MLEWTGERYLPFTDPSICGAEIHYEHLHRYAFATQFVKGKKVLDLASGEGYGSYLLVKNAESVIGIDIDPASVQHASKTYIQKNLKFLEGSILDIPIKGEKIFDVIICFEAIEHIDEQDILLSEIKRLLKENGTLIVSTPNKKIYTDLLANQNLFHKKELNYSEFDDLLRKYFLNVRFFGQSTYCGSIIFHLDLKKSSSCREFLIEKHANKFSFTEENKKIPVYFIAIASDGEIKNSALIKSYLVDKSNTEIILLNNQISQNNVIIQSLQQQVNEGGKKLKEMTAQIIGLNQTAAVKDEQLKKKDDYIKSLEQYAALKNQHLQELLENIRSLNGTVTEKDEQLKKKDDYIKSLEIAVIEKDAQVKKMNDYIQTFDQMKK